MTALYRRDDGIVDFNNQRCIGCKACMQACPYDALYIDPETNTAAKCNYCAHRVDVGLEPACVNVCPTQAIISGDLDDPKSNISRIKNRNQVTARKAEKGTLPALFYINGDLDSLDPLATPVAEETMWGTQVAGVGHWAADHESHALDRLGSLLNLGDSPQMAEREFKRDRSAELLESVRPEARRAYDAPQKGVLWGWQVSAYLWTKSISAGACLLPMMAETLGLADVPVWLEIFGLVTALVFLGLTGMLLMWDLDQPKRFLYVLLRPQWKSWLVKGAYIITGFAVLLLIEMLLLATGWQIRLEEVVRIGLLAFATLAAIYTAFLFAQAKGRDFWQSPVLPIHMLTHSLTAGAAIFMLLTPIVDNDKWTSYIALTLIVTLVVHLACDVFELFSTHPTENATRTAHIISHGRYRNLFWLGSVLVGSVLPLLMTIFLPAAFLPIVGLLALAGVFIGQHIWVRAPQQIPLS